MKKKIFLITIFLGIAHFLALPANLEGMHLLPFFDEATIEKAIADLSAPLAESATAAVSWLTDVYQTAVATENKALATYISLALLTAGIGTLCIAKKCSHKHHPLEEELDDSSDQSSDEESESPTTSQDQRNTGRLRGGKARRKQANTEKQQAAKDRHKQIVTARSLRFKEEKAKKIAEDKAWAADEQERKRRAAIARKRVGL